jgi:hypothetical protein
VVETEKVTGHVHMLSEKLEVVNTELNKLPCCKQLSLAQREKAPHGPAFLGDTYGLYKQWAGTHAGSSRRPRKAWDRIPPGVIHGVGSAGVLPWRTSFPSSASFRAFLNLPPLPWRAVSPPPHGIFPRGT